MLCKQYFSEPNIPCFCMIYPDCLATEGACPLAFCLTTWLSIHIPYNHTPCRVLFSYTSQFTSLSPLKHATKLSNKLLQLPCHFSFYTSSLFMCAPHLCDASSPHSTAIGYESGTRLRLNVKHRENGKISKKRKLMGPNRALKLPPSWTLYLHSLVNP